MKEKGDLSACLSKTLHHSTPSTLMTMLHVQKLGVAINWGYRTRLIKANIANAQAQLTSVAARCKHYRESKKANSFLQTANDLLNQSIPLPEHIKIIYSRADVAIANELVNQLYEMADPSDCPMVHAALSATIEFGHDWPTDHDQNESALAAGQ